MRNTKEKGFEVAGVYQNSNENIGDRAHVLGGLDWAPSVLNVLHSFIVQ